MNIKTLLARGKEILQDKALTTKYIVLIFAVINSVLNLCGLQTIGDEQVNDVATAITTIASACLLLNVRAHEIRNLTSKDAKEEK